MLPGVQAGLLYCCYTVVVDHLLHRLYYLLWYRLSHRLWNHLWHRLENYHWTFYRSHPLLYHLFRRIAPDLLYRHVDLLCLYYYFVGNRSEERYSEDSYHDHLDSNFHALDLGYSGRLDSLRICPYRLVAMQLFPQYRLRHCPHRSTPHRPSFLGSTCSSRAIHTRRLHFYLL